MEEYAPLSFALEFDNVGLILGSRDRTITKVMVALDLTDSVADEAVENGAGMVVTHHPPFKGQISRVTGDDALGRRMLKLLRNDIALYVAHTNLDIAIGGVNDTLADIIGLKNRVSLDNRHLTADGPSLGRVGELPEPCTLGELAQWLKSQLELDAVGVTGDPGRMLHRVGLCTGSASGREYIALAKAAGCDAFISGDVTYHNAQFAADSDIGLIDATHYGTEVIIVNTLKEMIEARVGKTGLTVITPQGDTRFMRSY
jgi:dinuclear metal center YbgI/SA1388 family protein